MDRQPKNGSLLSTKRVARSERARVFRAPSRLIQAARDPAAGFVAALLLVAVGFAALTSASFGSVEATKAGVAKPRSGNYKGKTEQASVAGSARRISFRVKGRRITLTAEPVVRRGFCLTPPVFIEEEGQVVTKKISRNGTFSFERTFVGQRVNRIRGSFVDDRTIEGTATYHFYGSASGQCSAGKESPAFTATR